MEWIETSKIDDMESKYQLYFALTREAQAVLYHIIKKYSGYSKIVKCAEIGLALNKKQFLDVNSHLKSIRMVANKMIKLFISEKIENKELMARLYGLISMAHEVIK